MIEIQQMFTQLLADFAKTLICRRSKLSIPHFFVCYIPYVIIVNSFPTAQLQSWLESDRSETLQKLEIAPDTVLEKKSWTFLQTRLKLLLAAYRTTLEEDSKLLNGNHISANKKLAIRMRLTEKRILKDTINFVEQRLVQL